MKHYFEYVVLKSVQSILLLLPLSTVRSLGSFAGGFVFKALGFRRGITLENLRHAFPDKTEAERRSIATHAFESIGTTLFEFLWFPNWSIEALARDVDITNVGVMRQAYKEGKGVVVLSAHYGSWEVWAQACRFVFEAPGTLLAKVQSNLRVNAEVDQWRRKFGNTTVPTSQIREILRALQRGGWVAIAGDQSAPRESLAVTFFGRTVSTFQGPAVFALRTGAALVLTLLHRGPDGRYSFEIERIPHDDLKDASDENIRTLTERHVRVTERMIREQPDQWMWMHKRWKHLSDGESQREKA